MKRSPTRLWFKRIPNGVSVFLETLRGFLVQKRQHYLSRLYIFWNKLLHYRHVCVYYGYPHIPQQHESVCGGMTKFQRMQHLFPNSGHYFNLLYLGSSTMPGNWAELLHLARQRGAKIVVNQNGVAYPAWDANWENTNQPYMQFFEHADYIFYQSRFAKLSADRFVKVRRHNWEILYNAVDTSLFTPARSVPDEQPLVLLLAGTQQHYYRLDAAVRTLAILVRAHVHAHLLVAGRLSWMADGTEARRMAQRLVMDQGVADHVTFLGGYTQEDAPAMFHQAHLLLHTQYNDVCPSVVIEAMACGLPIVHSQSGGVPELVGESAGIGAPSEVSWEREMPPDPAVLAQGVLQVFERRTEFAEAARQRAVEHFDLQPWLQRHQEVFERLLER